MSWTAQRLRQRVKEFHSSEYSWSRLKETVLGSQRKAAVLIPLVIKEGRLYVWLTLRSMRLRNDGGDVAFPGGMKDPDDADEYVTCLREAHEEIGLEPSDVEPLATLCPTVNRRQILVTPVVGLVNEHFEPVPNPDEVDAAFMLPLERFLEKRDYTDYPVTSRGQNVKIRFFEDEVDGQVFRTWGLTAFMCVDLAIALYERMPDFELTMYEYNAGKINPYTRCKEYIEQYIKDKEKEQKDEKKKLQQSSRL